MMMISDTERREAAAWLRGEIGSGYYWPGLLRMSEALGVPDPKRPGYTGRLLGRLADLIEPGDMSQSCRDTVARGIDSIYDWCFERLEGADGAEDELYCSIMSAIEDYRHPERVTARTARPVDRDALLALAKVLGGIGDRYNEHERYELGTTFKAIADRIREACGVYDHTD